MNKLLKGIFTLTIFILILIGTRVYAATPTLEQIINAFNNCSTVKEYATYGSVWNASSNGNKLTISVTVNSTTTNLEYTLEGSILSANFSGDETFTGLVVSRVLIDSIGQLHGYSDGELFTTLNSDKISSYSVENEGLEVKELTEESYQIKIDISKKIPLIDVSNVYIEISDLEDFKDYISGDGSAEKSKGNVWFNKNGYNGENTVLIAEKDGLTDNTYKSILSIIEVMFDSREASDYFKSNYSGISVGNKEFTGVKIEINPTKTEFEERLIPSDSGYEFARITIDKNLVNSTINGANENIGDAEEDKKIDSSSDTEEDKKIDSSSDATNKESDSSAKKQDNVVPSEKLPQAGLNMTIPIASIIAIILVSLFSYKKYNSYKDVK